MKKAACFIVLFFSLLFNRLSAQVIPQVGIDLGIATPLSDFAKTNINNQSSGFAKEGFAAQFSLTIKTRSGIAFDFHYANITNAFSIGDYADGINSKYAVAFYDPGDQVAEYSNKFVMPGISYERKIFSNLFSFNLGGQIGYSWCDRTSFQLQMDDHVKHLRYVFTEDAQTSTGMAMGMHGSLRANLGKFVGLGLQLSYFSALQTFEYSAIDNSGNRLQVQYNMPIDILMFALSLRINII